MFTKISIVLFIMMFAIKGHGYSSYVGACEEGLEKTKKKFDEKAAKDTLHCKNGAEPAGEWQCKRRKFTKETLKKMYKCPNGKPQIGCKREYKCK